MQLGTNKAPSSSHLAAEWAEEAAAEAEAEEGLMHQNPWGSDDLMDVNADQDDWSELTDCGSSQEIVLMPVLRRCF